jgi:DNA repair protein RadA
LSSRFDLNSGKIDEQHKVSSTNNTFFKSAADQLYSQQQQRRKERLSTGSVNLDDLLSGGLETGTITQFYGPPTAGKTHLCHLLCVVLPFQYQVIYIDTEGTFRAEKIKSIAQARGLDSNILCNIYPVQPTDSEQQESYIEEACSTVKSNSKIKLLIVDSMMFHYRGEYPGRSGIPKRAHRLNIYMHMLSNIAQTKNIAVVITNQVYSNPILCSYADKFKPTGGNVISYTSNYIINLEFMDSVYRRAILKKSPCKGPMSYYLMIHESGFKDQGPY